MHSTANDLANEPRQDKFSQKIIEEETFLNITTSRQNDCIRLVQLNWVPRDRFKKN